MSDYGVLVNILMGSCLLNVILCIILLYVGARKTLPANRRPSPFGSPCGAIEMSGKTYAVWRDYEDDSGGDVQPAFVKLPGVDEAQELICLTVKRGKEVSSVLSYEMWERLVDFLGSYDDDMWLCLGELKCS